MPRHPAPRTPPAPSRPWRAPAPRRCRRSGGRGAAAGEMSWAAVRRTTWRPRRATASCRPFGGGGPPPPPPGGGAKQQSALPHDAVVLFGLDLSPLEPWVQFAVCASGVFGFTIVYGYLQELLAVHISGRKFGLWLAWFQFGGYAFWSLVLTKVQKLRQRSGGRSAAREVGAGGGRGGGGTPIPPAVGGGATTALPSPPIP